MAKKKPIDLKLVVNKVATSNSYRRESKAGVLWYVVNAKIIKLDRVMNGSNGGLLYPSKPVEATVGDWENQPITVNHPKANGVYVSAKSSEGKSVTVGFFKSPAIKDNTLNGEVWIHVEKAKKIAPTIVSKIESGIPLEVSSGMFTKTKAAKGIVANKSYSAEVTSIVPDHVAILVDEVGACSNKDGCGIFVNSKRKGKKMTKSTAKAASRQEMIEQLVGNCECSKKEADKKAFEGMSDETLTKLVANSTKAPANTAETEEIKNLKEKITALESLVATKKEEKAPTTNKEEPKKEEKQAAPVTAEEWLKTAPPAIASIVTNAMKRETETKNSLIEKITANKSNKFSKEYLASQPVELLEGIFALIPQEESAPTTNSSNYAINGTAYRPTVNTNHKESPLVPPRMSFGKDK